MLTYKWIKIGTLYVNTHRVPIFIIFVDGLMMGLY
jgi:hypothetical protein